MSALHTADKPSPDNAQGTPKPADGGPRRAQLLWLLFAAVLAFYAVLVMQSGVHNLPSNFDPQHLELLDQVEAKGNQGVPYEEVAQAAREAYPWWNNLMARITGTYYGFGSNGTTDPTRYYASMAPTDKSVLSVHMILGGVCLVLGVFQFWPAFRRQHRQAHRVVGGLYVLSTYVMVAAAVQYLLHTGVANTYQGFTFHLQLWFLVVSTLVTQTLSLYYLRQRNIAMHFGLQVYTFAAFLSAPLQRYDWVLFGAIFPHLSQGEVNNMINLMAFWQCLLVGYLIFAWNRATSPLRPNPVPPAAASPAKTAFFALFALVGMATTVAFYVVWPGLGQWHVARSIVPASTLAADAALFEGRLLQNIAFTVATSAAIVSGLWLLMRDAASVLARRVFYASAVVSGLFQLGWAWQLGEPTMEVISGGGFYAICGLSLIGFALAARWLARRGQHGLWREVMVFGVNFAFAPALLLWLHALWYALGVIPQQYLDVGHGYILAAGGAILTPMMNGFFGAFGSSETRSRAIS